ncbi:MAG: helix-turn-helix domain-containing protein [Planctomycetes bacterium]|nr:helix-turn-helix domain-containing protein [Planctomycetota bacterium]
MRVGELAKQLQVPYRDVRYVLEQGVLPAGVEQNPGRGEHRDLDPSQSFWLAIVLMLKRNGVRVPDAQRVADFAREGVRGVTQNLNWEYPFNPFAGQFETENQWYVDIGDMKYIRLVTTANPSVEGLYAFPWSVIGTRKAANDAVPVVTLRLDLTGLARMMAT